MAVTRTSRSIVMTANADEVNDVLFLKSLQFAGTGLTVAQRITVTNAGKDQGPLGSPGTALGGPSIVADHVIGAVQEHVELLQAGPIDVRGLKITVAPAGTWTLTAIFA